MALLIVESGLADDTIDAAQIYQASCSVCHGDDGSGAIWGRASLATAPRDFTSDDARRELTRERMIASITYGRPQTPMPGFGTQLSMEEIGAVTDHIRNSFMNDDPPDRDDFASTNSRGGSTDMPTTNGEVSGTYPDRLLGDVDRGRAFYMANCVACHGATGSGDGPRAYFIFPKPRNFRDPATQRYMGRPALYRGIKDGVIGKEMPAWGKVMNDQQIADVAEYVFQQFISAPASPSENH